LAINRPFSVLDLSPIAMGSDAGRSLRNSLDLAQHAEHWGYRRYWLAEHHGMPGIASAATSVVICHVASGLFGKPSCLVPVGQTTGLRRRKLYVDGTGSPSLCNELSTQNWSGSKKNFMTTPPISCH
jgi:hypothetical protein